jgi:23S rRNA (guanosine2251-2'-O)-methyltransferase
MRKPFRPRPPRPPGGAVGNPYARSPIGSKRGHPRKHKLDSENPTTKSETGAGLTGRAQRFVGRTKGEQRPASTFDVARSEEHRSNQDLVFGVEPIRELIAAAPAMVRVLYLKEGFERRFVSEAAAVRQHGGRVAVTGDDELTRLAGAEARHQGIVANIHEYRYAAVEDVIAQGADPIVVIDGVTDPRNLGAILRSAECAGVRAAVIGRNRTAGMNPAAIKASAGSWIHLAIAQCGNVVQALQKLKEAGYWIAALAPGGETSIYDLDTSRRLAIVLGSEDRGVRELVRKNSDFIVNIPMGGRITSLNVSVAAAVALFEIARRRSLQSSDHPIQ